jgi:hypothetical protein
MKRNKDSEPTYGPMPASISHGSTEVTAVVKGKTHKTSQGGEKEQTMVVARVVLTPDDGIQVINGDMGEPVSIYEAGKIADPELLKELNNASKRERAARKKKEENLNKKLKKGAR